jgi:arylsulfatase A-like enzyme
MTLPSHASLLTGNPPPVHGVRINALHRLPEAAETLAEVLQAEGYDTAAFLSANVLDRQQGLAQGFATYRDEMVSPEFERGVPMVEAPLTTRRFLEWLEQQRTTPFFAWVHYFDPHEPYRTPPGLAGKFAHNYDAEIHFVDLHIAKILEVLEERDLDQNTVICITSDHGEGLGEHEPTHGFLLYEPTVQVPLILVAPGLAAQRFAAPISLIDVGPTLLDLLGAPTLDGRGRSVMPFLRGDAVADQRPLYLESYATYLSQGWSPLEGVVTQQWKYVHAPRPELYDLQADRGETANLATDRPQEAALLRQTLGELRRRPETANSTVVDIDEATAQSLAELGYLIPSNFEGMDRPLPEPGPEAGADPKDKIHLMPLLQELELEKMARGERTEEIARKLLAADPQNPAAIQTLGISMVRRKAYQEALAFLVQLDEQGRSSEHSLASLGVARRNTGNPAAAVSAFQRCLKMNPNNQVALANLGSLFEEVGDAQQALQYYQTLLEVTRQPEKKRLIQQRIEALSRRSSSSD